MKRTDKELKFFLLTIGREILTGRTLDTNAHWLADRITRLGGSVRQMTSVDDRLEEIVAEIRAARRLRCNVLITTGGLGPTHDDLTLSAVGAAAEKRLRVNPRARAIVSARYSALHKLKKISDPAMGPARLKMARLPSGATPLDNRVGTAPGAHLIWKDLQVFCLPGIPTEMKAMFSAEVAPQLTLRVRAGGASYRAEARLRTDINDESRLSPMLAAIRRSFPDVYVKSHPQGFGAPRRIIVTFAAAGRSAAEARFLARSARKFMLEILERK